MKYLVTGGAGFIGSNYSVNQIAFFISDNTINIPERLGEARETLANIKKVKDVFNWEPTITLDQWFKERNL
jgi:nucleoside-diphosphate-sugar epimerase